MSLNMPRRLLVLGILSLVLLALAGSAAADTCKKCDQSTGYWCYISTYGKFSGCDTPTLSGCVLWGSCVGGGCEPAKKCPLQNAQLWSDDFKLASVTISNSKSEKLVTVVAPAGHEVASR